jgi:hypothetical protein
VRRARGATRRREESFLFRETERRLPIGAEEGRGREGGEGREGNFPRDTLPPPGVSVSGATLPTSDSVAPPPPLPSFFCKKNTSFLTRFDDLTLTALSPLLSALQQPELFIHVIPDKTNNTLTIIDSGIGMTKAGSTQGGCTS